MALSVRPGSSLVAALLLSILPMGLPAAAQDRALVIGVGAYADPRLAAFPKGSIAGDVAAIEKLLTGTLRFKKEEIKVLRDAQATRAAVLDAIADWLRPDRKEVEQRLKDEEAIKAGKIKKQQIRALRRKWAKAARKPKRSYLYFAGYGFHQNDIDGDETDGRDEALVPYDAHVAGKGDHIRISGLISDDDFSAALRTLEGRRVTIVLDASYSGAARRGRASGTGQERLMSRAPVLDGAGHAAIDTSPDRIGNNDGSFVEAVFAKGTLSEWSAASAGQAALLDSGRESPRGLFTRLYSEGLGDGKADLNGNGAISNTELLRYLIDASAAFCAQAGEACRAGLTPRLYPVKSYGFLAKSAKRRRRKLSIGLVTDFLVASAGTAITIDQIPPSPVRVGDTRIRFSVTSPHDGSLILLSVTDKGHLIQLFPNQFAKPKQAAGMIAANVAVSVPDADYGMQLTATDPAKGHVIALFTRDPVDFGSNVKARSIGDIPYSEALRDYLPGLAAALLTPVHGGTGDKAKRLPEWSIATLAYEIVP